MSDILISVEGLKKYFPITAGIFRRTVGNIKAVDGIDFKIYSGEVLGLVGESGSGKSTAARAATRLIEPTDGKITFLGEDFLNLDASKLSEARRQIQMVFQDPYSSLNPRKTVGESVGEALLYHGIVKDKEEQIFKTSQIMKQIGLSGSDMARYPHQFSGGQQQRLCIGRAIATSPKLIVCDEAVSALDVSVQAQILNLLIELKTSLSLSYLFIAHDLAVVRHIADRVLVMYLGKVMESAPVEELFNNPKHPYTKSLLSAIPRRHPRKTTNRMLLKGDQPSVQNPPSGCPFKARCPYAKPVCSEPPPKKSEGEHFYYCILD